VAAVTPPYRDLRFALPFLLHMWMYATPIVYPASGVVDPRYRVILWINPISVAVESIRHMFTGASTLNLQSFAIAGAITLSILVSGLFVFNKVQRTFVDTV
jgi:lipopolysaccharide transport system permease protein